MLQHYTDDPEAETILEEQMIVAEWISDISELCRVLKAPSPLSTMVYALCPTPMPPGALGQDDSPVDHVINNVFGAAEPMFGLTVSHPVQTAKRILAAATKAGYKTLLKHYNRVDSMGILACALDPRFNLIYFKESDFGDEINDTYIPLCVLLLPFCCPFQDPFTNMSRACCM